MPSLENIQGDDLSQHLQISGRPGDKSEVEAGWEAKGKGQYVKKHFRKKVFSADIVRYSDSNGTGHLCITGTHHFFYILADITSMRFHTLLACGVPYPLVA